MDEPIPAIVLAGGKAKPDLQQLTGQESRALVEIGGKTLLGCVIDALTEAAAATPIGPLTVVGDMPAHAAYTVMPDAGGFVENVFGALSRCAGSPHALIATCDLPFLSADSVSDFVARSLAAEADLVWPIVPVAACYRRFPGVKRTAVKVLEGEFTGGNLMLVRPDVLLRNQRRVAEAYAARKSPLRIAGILGPSTLIRLLLSQTLAPRLLTLAYLEAQVSRVLGGSARAVISDYPEIATDLDRASDFQAVMAMAPSDT